MLRIAAPLLSCLLLCSPARAQVAAGGITGIVKDQAGVTAPGVTVTVTDTATNLQRVVVTTDGGVYTASSLAPSVYRLDVELAGFKPIRRGGVRVATGQTVRLDFALAVGDIREQITVTADAPMLRA